MGVKVCDNVYAVVSYLGQIPLTPKSTVIFIKLGFTVNAT